VTITADDIARYRARAETCRQEAESARDDADKQAWLEMARDWMKLADNGERRALEQS
jgi:hypothetical protein